MTTTVISNKELANKIESRMKDMIKGVVYSLYPEITKNIDNGCEEARKHIKVKHYQALDRIQMYLAHMIANTSFYEFDLQDMVAKKERKTLKAMDKALENITYLEIREIWHNSLKEIFYKQKEMKAEADQLKDICVLLRMEIGEEKGFVSIVDGEIKVVKKPNEATEFVAVSTTESALKLVQEHIFNVYTWECRAFFNKKMSGRDIYSW